jgi:hypothetical protein
MTVEPYNFQNLTTDKALYFFVSQGNQGTVVKAVTITKMGRNLWNLGFGDWDLSNLRNIQDSVVTNNNDLVRVITTVATIAFDYLETFPKRRLRIKPVDEKRERLYNHAFRRNYAKFTDKLDIKGSFEGKFESYSPEKT